MARYQRQPEEYDAYQWTGDARLVAELANHSVSARTDGFNLVLYMDSGEITVLPGQYLAINNHELNIIEPARFAEAFVLIDDEI